MNIEPAEVRALSSLRQDSGPDDQTLARVERGLMKEYRIMNESVFKRHAAGLLLALAGVGISGALAGAASYRWWERYRVVTDEPAGNGQRHLRLEDNQGRVIMDGLVGEDESLFIGEPGAEPPEQDTPPPGGAASGEDDDIFEMLDEQGDTPR